MLSERFSFFLACIFIVLQSCGPDLDSEVELNETQPYRLIINSSLYPDDYLKERVLFWFERVAFGSEYGNNFQITTKWKHPMRVFIHGTVDSFLRTEIQQVTSEINQLASDGFNIEIVTDSISSNFQIFIGYRNDYYQHSPIASSIINGNDGLVSIYWNNQFEIESGHMFVNLEHTTPSMQRHIAREELTQALGLTNDIPYADNSIFFEGFSTVTEYSDFDVEIIRLLYHPKMRSGLTKDVAVELAKEIMDLN